jgi:tRNA-dihydrouridine synthase
MSDEIGTERFCPALSVKTRLGIDKPIVEEWIPVLLKQPIDFLSVHGRTLKQAYAGNAC